jgi:hypothetical protein
MDRAAEPSSAASGAAGVRKRRGAPWGVLCVAGLVLGVALLALR